MFIVALSRSYSIVMNILLLLIHNFSKWSHFSFWYLLNSSYYLLAGTLPVEAEMIYKYWNDYLYFSTHARYWRVLSDDLPVCVFSSKFEISTKNAKIRNFFDRVCCWRCRYLFQTTFNYQAKFTIWLILWNLWIERRPLQWHISLKCHFVSRIGSILFAG